MAYNLNFYVAIEGLRKATCSRMHCKSVNISETVKDRDVVTTDH